MIKEKYHSDPPKEVGINLAPQSRKSISKSTFCVLTVRRLLMELPF